MSYNPFTLEGKTILVTGASSGIGRATAIACSRMGANVVITGRNPNRLRDTLEQLEKKGCHAQIIGDLTDTNDLNALVDNVPILDGLVNNAGISFTKPIGFLKQEDIQTVYETNLYAPMMLTNNLLKRKK